VRVTFLRRRYLSAVTAIDCGERTTYSFITYVCIKKPLLLIWVETVFEDGRKGASCDLGRLARARSEFVNPPRKNEQIAGVCRKTTFGESSVFLLAGWVNNLQ